MADWSLRSAASLTYRTAAGSNVWSVGTATTTRPRVKRTRWTRKHPRLRPVTRSKCISTNMAKKTTKQARGEQYRDIMEKQGIRDYAVLSFVFEQERANERFHYRLLLTVPGPKYYLFDCFEKTANVIVPNDELNAAWVQELAEQVGGQKTTPNLR